MLMLMFTILRSTLSRICCLAQHAYTKNRGEKNKNTKKLSLRSRTLNNNECAPFARTHLYHTLYTCSKCNVFQLFYSLSLAHSLRSIMCVFLFLYASFVLINVCPIHTCIRKKHTNTHIHQWAIRSFYVLTVSFLFNSFMLWFCALHPNPVAVCRFFVHLLLLNVCAQHLVWEWLISIIHKLSF